MTTVNKITLPFSDLECQKVLQKKVHFIELKERSFRWVYEAWVNHKDEETGAWNERLVSYDCTGRKDMVGAVELAYTEAPSLWKIAIHLAVTDSDIAIYFKKEQNARELLQALNEYFGF